MREPGCETDLQRGGHVVSRPREQQREMPDALKLKKTPEKDPGRERHLMGRPIILPPAAARNEVRIHRAVLGGELQGLAR